MNQRSDIGAQDDGNMCNDAYLIPETKGGNNGSSKLPENQHDSSTADQEPDNKKKKKFHHHGTTPPLTNTTLAESTGPMEENDVLASPGEEGTGKNADSYRKPSKRPRPAHSITSPPPRPSAPPSSTNTPTLSGNQQYRETQNDVNEAPTKKEDDTTTSIPASTNSNHPGQQQGIKDERRERSRVLAQRRRERKKEADTTIKERIDQVSKANELLRNKIQASVQELVSLGFDVKTVMSRIASIPHSKRRRSDTNHGDEDYHTIEVPRNNQSAESTSNQHQVHQHHQLQHQQHPNHHYQNLLSSYLGRANTTGNAAFLQPAVGEHPPSQLSSSPSPLLPHHQQHQQWIHLAAYADQQRRWQQQQAMLLGSASNNGQENAPNQH